MIVEYESFLWLDGYFPKPVENYFLSRKACRMNIGRKYPFLRCSAIVSFLSPRESSIAEHFTRNEVSFEKNSHLLWYLFVKYEHHPRYMHATICDSTDEKNHINICVQSIIARLTLHIKLSVGMFPRHATKKTDENCYYSTSVHELHRKFFRNHDEEWSSGAYIFCCTLACVNLVTW